MKRKLLAACAAIALSASGSLAGDLTNGGDYYAAPPQSSYGPAGIFGDINLSGTYFGGDIPDDFSLDLGGSIVLPFGNGWNAALDHDLGYRFEAQDWYFGGTGHLFYGNQAFAAGAFAHADTDEIYGAGVEGAAFVNNADVIAKVGYFNGSLDHWAAEGSANVYFDPDTAISGAVGGYWGDSDGWSADVGLEHRFTNSPFSGFAEIGYTDLDGANAYSVTGGARFVFGDSGSTLQEFNRRNPF